MNVFTDGACINNGKPNAKASWAVVFPEHPELDVSGLLDDQLQTNNRAEFTAVIKALEISTGPVHVFTDSLLVLKVSKGEWKAKKNLDLVEKILNLSNERIIEWTHVPAHTGKNDYNSIWNDVADKRAESLLKKYSRVDLCVPFTRKDEAKSQGALWDPVKKTWFTYTNNQKLINEFSLNT
ncbi:hypothetical protein EBT25_02375 [bacterium]|nr:hypothetical protein [bacterium]